MEWSSHFAAKPAILAGMATTTEKSGKSRSGASSDVDYDKLCSAVNACYRSLEPFRRERAEAVRQYAGNHYGKGATDQRVPLNLIAIYVQVMTRLLVAKIPRVMISTFDKKMKPYVSTAEQWTNEKLEEMHFDETLERWVMDSFFLMGIMKVCLGTPNDAVTNNWDLDAGDPFAEIVDFDDFVFDVHARRLDKATFMGHRVRIQKDVLLDDKQIPAKKRKKLDQTVDVDEPHVSGDMNDKVASLQRNDETINDGGVSEFGEFIDCWEIFDTRRKCIYLFLADEMEAVTGTPEPGAESCEPLKIIPWIGPPCGPYHVLALGLTPDNAVPKGPIMDLMDLHLGFNACFVKAMQQAERQKLVYACRAAATKDGSRFIEAPDGVMIIVDDPQGVAPIAFPGADATLVQFAMMLKDLFDFMAGNLTTLTGRAPAAPTATQEKILAAGSSAQVDDMSLRVLRGAGKAIRSLFWYWWHDPFKTMRSELSIPGLPDISTTRYVKPENREEGHYSDMSLKVDAYSMQPKNPQARLQAIMGVIQNIWAPFAQQAKEQGVSVDLPMLLDFASKMMDEPAMPDIITYTTPPETAGEQGASGDMPGKPAATERTYNRVSTSEKTSTGEANGRIAAMGEAASNGQISGQGM